ncbi:MAG TPA: hypothetical protein VF469_39895 [Kofleriaceae bacterium]
MSLTAVEMRRLEEDARAIATSSCRGYLSDALQCLRETGDPIAPLALLRALWSAGHAKRDHQKLALDDAGQWLEKRLAREPGVASERLALELGWLHRLVTIQSETDSDFAGAGRVDRLSSRRAGGHGRGRDEPGFGAHITQLQERRARARARVSTEVRMDRREAGVTAEPSSPRPERLPDSFEVRFTSWQETLDVFRTARKRRKERKAVRDRLLLVQPVLVELQHLAADLACSLLETEGMDELQARTVEGAGKVPSFWIAIADLVDRDGKRISRRIAFEPRRAGR